MLNWCQGYVDHLYADRKPQQRQGMTTFLTWCAERGLDPLAAQRPHLELYIRWMQDIRRFLPSRQIGC